jgi:tetratricopeptide (TPR) repeat protein
VAARAESKPGFNSIALVKVGGSARELGDFALALRALDDAGRWGNEERLRLVQEFAVRGDGRAARDALAGAIGKIPRPAIKNRPEHAIAGMGLYLRDLGTEDEARTCLDAAIRSARKVEDPADRAEIFWDLGGYMAAGGLLADSRSCTDQAFSLLQEFPEGEPRFRVMRRLLSSQLKEDTSSFDFLFLNAKHDYSETEAEIARFHLEAVALGLAGEVGLAGEKFNSAAEAAERLPTRWDKMEVLLENGLLLHQLGLNDASRAAFEDGLEIAKLDESGQFIARFTIAQAWVGDYGAALHSASLTHPYRVLGVYAWGRGLGGLAPIAREDVYGVGGKRAEVLVEILKIDYDDPVKAKAALERTLHMAAEITDPWERTVTQVDIALVQVRVGEVSSALATLKEAFQRPGSQGAGDPGGSQEVSSDGHL